MEIPPGLSSATSPRTKLTHIAVFAGGSFLIAYDYLGNEFTLDTHNYTSSDMWWISPVTGKCSADSFTAKKFAKVDGDDTDRVLVIK